MNPARPADMTDLRGVYSDLAGALGAAQRMAAAPGGTREQATAANQRVQQAWAQAVQLLGAGLDQAQIREIPPVVIPDPEAPPDVDLDVVIHHVNSFSSGFAVPEPEPVRRFGFTGSVRLAALIWCGIAAVLALLLGVTVAGAVVVPAFVPAIATTLLLAWRGIGRAPGALWAVGLLPLVLLLVGESTTAASAVAFAVLVEGFAYLTYLSGVDDEPTRDEPRVRRRPLEVELVLFSVAAWTTKVDVVALLVLACLGGLLWRRRWTAVTAAAVSALALFIEFAPWTTAPADAADLIVYVLLTVHWTRTVFHGPWYAGRLWATEMGLALGGRALRGGWRVARRTADNMLAAPPVTGQPGRGATGGGAYGDPSGSEDDGLRYCWTCHQQTKHEPRYMAPPVCRRCAAGATTFDRGLNIYEDCPECGGKTMHTHDGTCLSCRGRGR